eukprot:3521541-Ditylum_brightwellii.AAC.1
MKESLNSQMELHDVMLKPQIDQIIREKNEMKFKAQTLSFQNDELQEEVEGLGGWAIMAEAAVEEKRVLQSKILAYTAPGLERHALW